MNPILQAFTNQPVNHVRRNHALEHATLHVLGRLRPGRMLAGYSDLMGFWILGEVEIEDVQQAVEEALARLRAGEHKLAIQPNCGTNLAASALAAGGGVWLGMLGSDGSLKSRAVRAPLAAVLAAMAMLLTRPLGPWLQRNLTTLPDPGSLHVVRVMQNRRGRLIAHRVFTSM